MSAKSRPDPLFELFDQPAGSILLAAQEAIVLVDERQRIAALNPAAEKMFRCAAAEALGQSLERFVPAGPHAGHGACEPAEALQERLARHHRIAARRADGTEFPVDIRLSPVDMTTGDGVRQYFAVLLLDLSEQRQLRQSLHGLKRRLRSVFELAPMAIWISENDRIVFANHAAERMFGASRSIVGQALYGLLDPGSHAAVRAQVARALAGGTDAGPVHGRIARPDGSLRDVEIALAALPDHGRTTVQMAVADVTQRRREAAELEQSRESLRQLSTSMVEAREDERRRIARELHDELGQRLTALKMELSALSSTRGRETRQERIVGMLVMLDETLASVRRISSDLRPMMLDDLGLNAAIEWLARDAGRRMGIEVTVRLGESDPPVGERVATAVFRMVQEALTNVARHARASEAQIAVRQDGDELVISVEDNGIGYPESAMQREGSYGLLGMRERAAMFGGRLEIANRPDRGARLTVRLPLPVPRHAALVPAEEDGA
jgi:two-component system sensor histidine kinase UhpB